MSEYSGAQMQASRPSAAFAFEEEHLLAADEATNGVIVWDVRMRHIVDRLIGVPRGFALIRTTANRLTFALPFLVGSLSQYILHRSTPWPLRRIARRLPAPGMLGSDSKWQRCRQSCLPAAFALGHDAVGP